MICRCGHAEELHAYGRNHDKQRARMSCTGQDGFKFCKCEQFQEAKSQEEIEMAKEKKARVAKPKSEGRKPKLAGLVDSPFKIYITTGGKEYDAQVLSSGIIKIDEKEFTSPSSAGSYMLGKDEKGKPKQVDGWKVFSFNKDGKRVPLDTLRGSKSPLKAEAPKAAKKEKPASAKKAKPPRKSRAKKPTDTERANRRVNGAPAQQPQERETEETSTEATA